jgi:hypothetical protein
MELLTNLTCGPLFVVSILCGFVRAHILVPLLLFRFRESKDAHNPPIVFSHPKPLTMYEACVNRFHDCFLL